MNLRIRRLLAVLALCATTVAAQASPAAAGGTTAGGATASTAAALATRGIYLCGDPEPSDESRELLMSARGVEAKGSLQAFINNTSREQPYTYTVSNEETLAVETSVGGSIEASKVVSMAIQAGVTKKVETKTATTVGTTALWVQPGHTGYVRPYAMYSIVVYKFTIHVLRTKFLGRYWCLDQKFEGVRSAKIPTSSVVCTWESPHTGCSAANFPSGGGGGTNQRPGSGIPGPAPGPQPVHDVRGLADGTLLHTSDTGRIYKMVGGAPVWQATCDNGICSGTPRPTTQSVINAGPATPRNAASAIDQRGRVYIFVGGTPIWQDSCAAPVSCGNPVKVSDWSIDARDHMNQVPADGSLVQGRLNGTDLPVAMTVGGALVPVDSPQELIDVGQGADWASRVVAISGDSYQRIGFMPADGTLIQGAGATTTPVAAMVGGARINFASPQEVIDAGYGSDWASRVRAIPTRHFNLMPTVPRDGVLIQGSKGSTPVAAIVGTARVNFASPQEVIDAGYGSDWASKVHAVPARVFNEIRTGIIDGTRLGKAGATDEAAIVGGAKVPFHTAEERDEAGYGARPLQKIPARVWDTLPTTIADGTRLGKAGATDEAAIVGGAKVPFHTADERDEAGYGTRSLQLVPPRVWDALPTTIADGTRLGKAGASDEAAVVGGAKVPFHTAEERDEAGYGAKALQKIPARVWDALPATIADGTRLGKSGSSAEAAVVGGARIPFLNADERDEAGYGAKPLQKVPARVWDAMPTTIADGTRLGKSGSSAEAAVVGGARIPFANAAERDETGYGAKLLQKVPARVWDALPTTIADGTYVKAPGSATVWVVTNGRRKTASQSTGVWVIPARVLDAIPLG